MSVKILQYTIMLGMFDELVYAIYLETLCIVMAGHQAWNPYDAEWRETFLKVESADIRDRLNRSIPWCLGGPFYHYPTSNEIC